MTQKSIAWLLLILFFGFIVAGFINKSFLLAALGFISLFTLFIVSSGSVEKQILKANQQFKNTLTEYNFNPDKSKLTRDLIKGIGINEDRKKIAYLSRNSINDKFDLKEFTFDEIIEAKVVRNNETLTSTSMGSQALRYLTGGVLFGALGAVVGGATAKTSSREKIKELTLEIVVNDVLNPRYTLTFYQSDIPLDPTKEKSKKIIEEIDNWYRIFTVIIHRSEKVRSV